MLIKWLPHNGVLSVSFVTQNTYVILSDCGINKLDAYMVIWQYGMYAP